MSRGDQELQRLERHVVDRARSAAPTAALVGRSSEHLDREAKPGGDQFKP
jgi:hypothetical protein